MNSGLTIGKNNEPVYKTYVPDTSSIKGYTVMVDATLKVKTNSFNDMVKCVESMKFNFKRPIIKRDNVLMMILKRKYIYKIASDLQKFRSINKFTIVEEIGGSNKIIINGNKNAHVYVFNSWYDVLPDGREYYFTILVNQPDARGINDLILELGNCNSTNGNIDELKLRFIKISVNAKPKGENEYRTFEYYLDSLMLGESYYFANAHDISKLYYMLFKYDKNKNRFLLRTDINEIFDKKYLIDGTYISIPCSNCRVCVSNCASSSTIVRVNTIKSYKDNTTIIV